MIKKRVTKLHILEDELQDALNAVDEFLSGEIPQKRSENDVSFLLPG